MESTAQYWKPVWLALEPWIKLHLAQAQSKRTACGRKSDLADTKRLVKCFVAGELFLSFVPEPEQRGWRTVTRARLQLVRERVHLQNQIESLLEEGRIKLSSVISDLLGVSGRRIQRALAQGETQAEDLAALGDEHLNCGRAVLVDALTGAMSAVHRTPLGQPLDRIELLDRQIGELNRLCAAHAGAPERGGAIDCGARHRGRGRPGDHCRNRTGCERIPLGRTTGFLDRGLPRFQRECCSEPIRPLRQVESVFAATAVPSRAGGGQNTRQSPPVHL